MVIISGVVMITIVILHFVNIVLIFMVKSKIPFIVKESEIFLQSSLRIIATVILVINNITKNKNEK